MRLCAAFLAAFAFAPAAAATLRVQHGMAGVAVGASEQDVRAVLGRPGSRIDSVTSGSHVETVLLTYGRRRLFVALVGPAGRPRVSALTTTGREERTPAGIGVGSSEDAVRKRVPHVRCYTDSGKRFCQVGAGGRLQTNFSLRHGRVVRVQIVAAFL